MNKLLVLALLFLAVSLFNLLNVYLTGNGFSLVLGVLWLAGSAFVFLQYRKMKTKGTKDTQEEPV